MLFLHISPSMYGVSYPPISIFEPETYKGGNQNWKIHQLPNDDLVFANEQGLLIFNGEQWNLYSSHLSTIVRSVHAKDDIVYTGGDMDFGYWTPQNDGTYTYVSLVEKYDLKLIRDQAFWSIISIKHRVIFQSLSHLYIYNTKSQKIETIRPPGGINKIFDTGSDIFFQSRSWDIYRLTSEGYEIYYDGSQLPDSEIINMFYTDEGLKIFIKEYGFYRFRAGKFEKWSIPDQNILELGDFFSAIKMANGNFILGTITRGVIILSKSGKLLFHLNQMNGLSNNTVLSLFEDRLGSVWLGLDNGINKINLNSPFSEYFDNLGVLGTVYASKVYDDILYIGTNQGLFFKELNSTNDFRLAKKSNGQIWSLFVYDGSLFCGHNLGTYRIEKDRAIKISPELGTWMFTAIKDDPSIILQGNYSGLHLLKKTKDRWSYGNKVEGLDISARQFVYHDGNVYLYHLWEGLIKLELSDDFNEITKKTLLKEPNPSYFTNIIKVDGQIIFNDFEGIYRIDDEEEQLIPLRFERQFEESLLDPIKLIADENFFWIILDDGLMQVRVNDKDSLQFLKEIPIDPQLFKCKDEYENISMLAPGQYLVGMTNGYFVFNLDQLDKFNKDYNVLINSVELNLKNGNKKLLNQGEEGKLKNFENNFTFYYSVPRPLKYQDVEYRIQLIGESDQWSEWNRKNEVSFYKLRPGKYNFKVQGRISNKVTQNIAEYAFHIRQPWYWSFYSILAYSIMLLLAALTINYFYSRTYQKRQEKLLIKNQKKMHLLKLENEQELMKVRNEQLKAEIDAKNKEMAVTAMSVVKKNEFLIGIRDKLSKQEQKDQKFIKEVIVSINKEIENEESWEMLKDAFENIDKEFIKNLLNKHPGLTPSDLKLSTYLRLNLSSKEIASLLNISVRSMETKRYRLRKKLGLEHNTNLTEYILSV